MARCGNGEPYINAGELRHEVTFLRQTVTDDIAGKGIAYVADNPADIAYAKIEAVKNTDVLKDSTATSQRTVLVTVRYLAGRSPDMRLMFNKTGAIYVIQSIDNLLEQDILQVITCLALQGNS